jgi:hypothetical protein
LFFFTAHFYKVAVARSADHDFRMDKELFHQKTLELFCGALIGSGTDLGV